MNKIFFNKFIGFEPLYGNSKTDTSSNLLISFINGVKLRLMLIEFFGIKYIISIAYYNLKLEVPIAAIVNPPKRIQNLRFAGIAHCPCGTVSNIPAVNIKSKQYITHQKAVFINLKENITRTTKIKMPSKKPHSPIIRPHSSRIMYLNTLPNNNCQEYLLFLPLIYWQLQNER